MANLIRKVQAIAVRVARDTPYLGALEDGVRVSEQGYFVRPGNRSVYSIHDQSTLVRVECDNGAAGWGECVSFVVPEVAVRLIHDILGPLLVGRDPRHPAVLYHDMYDLMRVRGYFGGYWHDAIAAVDIALWDLAARLADLPLCELLGGRRHAALPAYVSGLPASTIDARLELAQTWQQRGFQAVKFAAAVAHEGTALEMRRLRETLGPAATILCDMHWKHTAPEAIRLIQQMQPYGLAVAEAPCHPEDVEGLAIVARAVQTPIGAGEELRTVFEYLPRLERRAIGVIQPEMGRTGVTSFMEICNLARAFHVVVMPHASIGIGIFQAASLHASAVLPHLAMHEYQHSIFDKNLRCVQTDMRCAEGHFQLPSGPGLGTVPADDFLSEQAPEARL